MIELEVNNKRYNAFERARITHSLLDPVSSFQIVGPKFLAGDTVRLYVDGVLSLTGYVEAIAHRSSTRQNQYEASGRALSAKCDSALIHDTATIEGDGLGLAQAICADLGVPIASTLNLVRTEKQARKGEPVLAVLHRIARRNGAILQPQADGGLRFTRVSSERLNVVLRNPIEEVIRIDMAERRQTYHVEAQAALGNARDEQMASGIAAKATDSQGVLNTKALARLSGKVTYADCVKYAAWMRDQAAGQSIEYQAKLNGFEGPSAVNTLLFIEGGINREMIISQAVFQYSVSTGSITELTLRPPQAFMPEPWRDVSKIVRNKYDPSIYEGVWPDVDH